MVLALSEERDRWMRFALSLAAEAYAAGRADERAEQVRRRDAAWRIEPPLIIRPDVPTFAELQQRRYGPRA